MMGYFVLQVLGAFRLVICCGRPVESTIQSGAIEQITDGRRVPLLIRMVPQSQIRLRDAVAWPLSSLEISQCLEYKAKVPGLPLPSHQNRSLAAARSDQPRQT